MFIVRRPARIAKARRYTKGGKLYRAIDRLSVQMEKSVQVSLMKGMRGFKSQISADALRTAFESGDYKAVMGQLNLSDLEKQLSPALDKLSPVAVSGAKTTLKSLPKDIARRLKYDDRNPLIRTYLKDRTGQLIQNVTQELRGRVRRAVRQTFRVGQTPQDVADKLRRGLTLNDRQAGALENFRSKLISNGTAPSRIDGMVNAYEARMLDYRALMIGRTETRLASNFGQLSVWQTGVQQDLLPSKAQKVWYTDSNPCELCAEMEGKAVPLDGTWRFGDGRQLDVPSESHPNCRCGMTLEFDGGEGGSHEQE